ncbi:glycosyl hydrolase 2 galactose-binding domain-containing protein [Caecibacteroides pullorum]|uniref:Discoidin domain-containing protein n=1 Tax=Caecibacteroides pullorum TaxID=2725562 RepID=A0AA40ZRR1_9BACT|nr:discoidin domain-containing protein [Caecibacteroides pullorum]MBV8057773.1 beta-glycosidase [Caecibacteroides pullorum]
MKKKKNIVFMVGGAGALLLLSGCSDVRTASEGFLRSDYYTRGIGVYPGSPQEDFSPELLPDEDQYRNLALLRATYQSSAYDYNLTSQLLTDGIVTDRAPQYFDLQTAEGSVPKREREWMIDGGPYSRNTVRGEEAFFLFSMHNYNKTISRAIVTGTLIYDDKAAQGGYEMTWEASNDGTTWTVLAVNKGAGLPGKARSGRVEVNDPNKQTGTVSMPMRRLEETFEFTNTTAYTSYRIRLRMKGAYEWTFHEVEFSNADGVVDLKPSQFFTSAWMSATAGEEWVSVDLGSHSEFDKVILHWVNKAVEGRIQTSDDAQTWADVASLPGGEGLTDEIAVRGKARYVRVCMDRSADGGRYILSELEVMGRGGLLPRAAAMPEAAGGRLTLSGGGWQLQRASEVQAGGVEIASPAYKAEGWVTATVPGTVLTSYKNVGALADPNYADNQLMISESFFNSNFWYRNEFQLPQSFKRDRVFLNFDGINWKANVYLNGKQVGRLEGAFIRGKFDVTDCVKEGTNVLVVEIIKNAHIGAIKEKNKQSTDFNGGILGADNPTFHATIGWDWIPTMRGRNIGIWNDVFLTTTGKVTVQDPYVQTQFALPDTTQARLTAEVVVKNHDGKDVSGVLQGRVGDVTFEQPVELRAGEERTVVFDADRFPQLQVKNPRLWWPNGYGTPYLYDANFTFKVGEEVSDARDFKVGIRQMTFNEDGGVLNLYVNGRRFIGRGGNWGFSESNLNYRGREYETAVAYHADMNFTMLRNWVGMIGDEELYDACDKYGIMIWQDFWLANPADGPDPYYPDMFIANAEDYVKRIRSHASIGLYCGRNEGFPPKTIDKALRRIVKEEHPGMHYISSSADDVVSGHGPYRMLPAKTYFTLETGNDKFHSERGMPNVLTYESFLRTYSPEGIWPQSDQWGMHDYTLEGAQGATSFNEIIATGYGQPESAKEFADLAQWVNYDGHRSLFESRSKNRMGLLMWMSHSCWPSMVWQTYDYYFEPTAAYFAIKKASEPLHIQWNPATDEVEVVNYHAGLRPGLKARVQVLNMDATVAWEKEVTVDSREDTTEKCIKLEFPDGLSQVHFIKLVLEENGKAVSENFYHRSKVENNYQALKQLPKVSLRAQTQYDKGDDGEWKAEVTVENRSDAPALMVRLNIVGDKDSKQFLPIFYSENYFALLPGETKVVRVHWKDVDTRGNAPLLKVSGYNVE